MQASRREVETSEAELRRLEAQVASISATVDRALVEANHRYEQRNVECVPRLLPSRSNLAEANAAVVT